MRPFAILAALLLAALATGCATDNRSRENLLTRAGFRTYQQSRGNPNSLSGDMVTSILVDSTGNWWIGSLDSGLNRYEPKIGRWTPSAMT
jgi:ligand-binding sensor domain-containing protein